MDRKIRVLTCIVCNILFEDKFFKKTCSKKCRNIHAKNRRNKTNKNFLKKFNCKYCCKEVERYKIGSGFCNRSCASKFYCQNGVYQKWIDAPERLKNFDGIYRKCLMCDNIIYVKPSLINKKKKILCSKKCHYERLKILFKGENSPTYGYKEKLESKEKKKKTLLKRYGITNAFYLSKYEKTSKPHIILYDALKKVFPKIIKEKLINNHLYADICLKNKIIEFYGNYWHCNPKIYSKEYFNKRKQMTAKEIWQYDEKRIKEIKNLGYDVLIIWEKDFKENMQNEIRKAKEFING